MTNQTLQAYFNFDDSDLKANRRGQFSEKQKSRLAALNTRERVSIKFLGILLVSTEVLVLMAAPFLYSNPIFLSVALPFGLIGGIIGVFVLRAKYKNKDFRLKKMQGRVAYTRYKPHDFQGVQYNNRIIHLGNSRFDVAEDMPTILKEGADYIVYTYAFQGSTKIISAELISEAQVPTSAGSSA